VSGVLAGTIVNVRILAGEKHFVSLLEGSSKLAAFSDDKGTDLTEGAKGSSFRTRWIAHSDVAEDGKSCVARIRTKTPPAQGAKAITVRATLVVLCGEDVQTGEQKDVPLVKDTKVELGPLPCTISKVSDKAWGKTKLTVSFQSGSPFDAIKNITFLKPDGTEIKHRRAGGMRLRVNDQYTYTQSYALEEKVEKATINVEFYGKTEEHAVPVDVTIGVGL
jgi:hypothetical protein